MKTSPSQKDLELLPHKFQVDFAIFCARQVEHLWNKYPECVKAVRVTEMWMDGKASAEDCRVAAHAAYAATYAYAAAYAAAHATYATYAATYATYAATYATSAAAYTAASATNKQKIIEAQWEYYNNLLHFDSIAENILLVGNK